MAFYPYQYQYPQSQTQYIPPTPTQNQASVPASVPVTASNLIWVQGEAGAKSYLVAPNMTVPLWDSENQTIYLKSADASGMPSMKILDYTIRERETIQKPINVEQPPIIDYATKDDLAALKKELKGEISEIVKKELGA